MGLNSVYNTIRGNILMMKPLPTINQAYAILVQEEKQREVHTESKVNYDSTAFTIDQTRGYHGNSYNSQRNFGSFEFGRGRGDYRKTPLFCTHCKKPGHSASKCYKLIGYPKDSRFTRGRGMTANTSVHSTFDTHLSAFEECDTEEKKFLSPDEYSQLMKLFSKVQTSEAKTHESNPSQIMSHAHFVGPFNEEPSGSW